MIRPTLWISLSLAGVACALTMLYLGMRSVMDVGGFCAEGGPFVIEQHCPQGVPGVIVGSILGGLVLAGIYAWQALSHGIPSFVGLLWPALFLSLGCNFLEYAFDPPGTTDGVVWGWLVCGVVFALMGGLPLLVVLPATIRSFTRDRPQPPGFPGGMPLAHMQRMAARAQPTSGGQGVVDELERLSRLHREGSLTDDEFEAAKRSIL